MFYLTRRKKNLLWGRRMPATMSSSILLIPAECSAGFHPWARDWCGRRASPPRFRFREPSLAATFHDVSRSNLSPCPRKKRQKPSFAAGPAKRRISKRLGTACRFLSASSTCPSPQGKRRRRWQHGPMLQKRDAGFSRKCRRDLAMSPLSASKPGLEAQGLVGGGSRGSRLR